MCDAKYNSIFHEELTSFEKLRKSQGIKDRCIYIMRKLDEFLIANNVNKKELTPEIVDNWIAVNSNGLSSNTLPYYISYCRKFAEYLQTLGFTAFVPEYLGYTDNYVPYIFSEHEINDIFQLVDKYKATNNKLTHVQFPMLLRILYGCGLRLGEALQLKLSDVDLANGIIYIWKGKNHISRLVPVDETLASILRAYCNTVMSGKSDDAYIFESDRKGKQIDCTGRPRDSKWASYIFQQILKKAGIEHTKYSLNERGICLHCLRHTFAVNSFRKQDIAGVDNYRSSPLLSIYLGHTKLLGTQKYLHMTAENSEDIIAMTSEYSKNLFPEVQV
jgi:integrase